MQVWSLKNPYIVVATSPKSPQNQPPSSLRLPPFRARDHLLQAARACCCGCCVRASSLGSDLGGNRGGKGVGDVLKRDFHQGNFFERRLRFVFRVSSSLFGGENSDLNEEGGEGKMGSLQFFWCNLQGGGALSSCHMAPLSSRRSQPLISPNMHTYPHH